MEIRKANINDLTQLINLKNELTDYHFELDKQYKSSDKIKEITEKDLIDFIQKDDCWIFVAEESSRILGYIAGAIRDNHYLDLRNTKTGNIKNFLVTKDARGKKVGKSIHERTIKFLKDQGIDYLEVSVNVLNKPSIVAYKKMGFKEFHLKLNQRI